MIAQRIDLLTLQEIVMARALPKPMPALAALVAGADVLTRPSGVGVEVSLDLVREAYSEIYRSMS
jgi:hypothetical protein